MNWSQKIEIGDILYCYFPFNKKTMEPSPFAHYVLVIDLDKNSKNLPIYLTVAYGTSKKTDPNDIYQSELLVTEERCSSFCNSGLLKPTKFDLINSLYLPYNSKYFVRNPNKLLLHPKQGNLDFYCNDDINSQMIDIAKYLKSIGHIY
jgi:hypothetical protein